MYRIFSRFVENVQNVTFWSEIEKRTSEKIEEKHLETDEFVEDSRNSQMTREKLKFEDRLRRKTLNM